MRCSSALVADDLRLALGDDVDARRRDADRAARVVGEVLALLRARARSTGRTCRRPRRCPPPPCADARPVASWRSRSGSPSPPPPGRAILSSAPVTRSHSSGGVAVDVEVLRLFRGSHRARLHGLLFCRPCATTRLIAGGSTPSNCPTGASRSARWLTSCDHAADQPGAGSIHRTPPRWTRVRSRITHGHDRHVAAGRAAHDVTRRSGRPASRRGGSPPAVRSSHAHRSSRVRIPRSAGRRARCRRDRVASVIVSSSCRGRSARSGCVRGHGPARPGPCDRLDERGRPADVGRGRRSGGEATSASDVAVDPAA